MVLMIATPLIIKVAGSIRLFGRFDCGRRVRRFVAAPTVPAAPVPAAPVPIAEARFRSTGPRGRRWPLCGLGRLGHRRCARRWRQSYRRTPGFFESDLMETNRCSAMIHCITVAIDWVFSVISIKIELCSMIKLMNIKVCLSLLRPLLLLLLLLPFH